MRMLVGTETALNTSTNNYHQTIFASTVTSHIIHTSRSNLATKFASFKLNLPQDKHTSYHHFTSLFFHLPSSILSDPVVNVITIPPKIWQKKAANKYKPLVHNDVDEDL